MILVADLHSCFFILSDGLFCSGRDLREYLVGKLIRPLLLKKFWFFRASCAKQAR